MQSHSELRCFAFGGIEEYAGELHGESGNRIIIQIILERVLRSPFHCHPY